MPKYKYFLLLFSCIAVLLLWQFFPISFDNNDDQIMFAISSGVFSNIKSIQLIHINVLWSKIIALFFQASNHINWYTLFLQIVQLFCFLALCYLFLVNKKQNLIDSAMIILIVFLGFFSLNFVKLQFTTVSIMCILTALFYVQSHVENKKKYILFFFLFFLSILIRKHAFAIFLIFSIILLFKEGNQKLNIRNFLLINCCSFIIFGLAFFVNSHYQNQDSNRKFNTLDIIVGKPTKIYDRILQKYDFTKDDISLMQSWFFADDVYLNNGKIEQFAKEIQAHRNWNEVKVELKKFINDERYVLIFYALSILVVLAFARKYYVVMAINFLLFCFLISYLLFTTRIPHRVMFPILTYLVLINLYWFLQAQNKKFIKYSVLGLFLIISAYKFYCTTKLISIQRENHLVFNACKDEINKHPKKLFIALDGFPLQYMNAWQTPENMFLEYNIIPTGWYVCTSDYQVLLQKHQLKNLTSSLLNKENVLFLTNSVALQKSYISVIKQRYGVDCHFENIQDGFVYLQPKKLVVDN